MSLLVVVGLLAVLFLFFSSDAFYIHSISVGGLTYMTKEEVFALTDIANLHVFWVDPVTVRTAIMRSPTVAGLRLSAKDLNIECCAMLHICDVVMIARVDKVLYHRDTGWNPVMISDSEGAGG